ncbi:autophagy-related protein 2 [Scheffersomyces coipomensis]|uniref:autophagy-related protein 2 n=1 Tax=Scheffersomyces coipomensis TaxID=1788519 RepID=UPI00315D4CBA
MSPQWIPQNIQKRLLLYVLQQLSLFSEIDLPNLEEVSLNNIILRNVLIDPEKVGKLPGCNLRFGQVGSLELNTQSGGGIIGSGGVNIDARDVELVISPDFDIDENISKEVQFSLAQSTADLANTIILDEDADADDTDDEIIPPETPSLSRSNSNSSTFSTSFNKPSALSSVMSKAVDMALSRLQVKITNLNIKVVSELTDLCFKVEEVLINTTDGTRNVKVSGVELITLKPNVNPGEGDHDEKSNPQHDEKDVSDEDEDNEDGNDYGDESLMDSMVFTHEEASSIYLSATSQSFAKSGTIGEDAKNSPSPKEHPVVFHMDSCHVSFEGLTNISDLVVDVGHIKVACIPLTPTIISIFNGITRSIKLKNLQKRKQDSTRKQQQNSRFPQYTTNDDDDVPVDDENSTNKNDENGDAFFNKLHVNEITVSATAALDSKGNFTCPDKGINFVFHNLNIKQKNESLIYGGVEFFRIHQYLNNQWVDLFYFEPPKNPETSTSSLNSPAPARAMSPSSISSASSVASKASIRADIRFEIFKKLDEGFYNVENTALFSKTAIFNLDLSSILILTNFGIAISSIQDSFKQLLSTIESINISNSSSNKTEKSSRLKSEEIPTRHQFILQTAPIILNAKFSDDLFLKLLAFPISFNLLKAHLSLSKIVITQVFPTRSEETIVTITDVSLITKLQEFKSFINRSDNSIPREISLNSELSLIVEKILINLRLDQLKSMIKQFTSLYQSFQDLSSSQSNSLENSFIDIRLRKPTSRLDSSLLQSVLMSNTSRNPRRGFSNNRSLGSSFIASSSRSKHASIRLFIKNLEFNLLEVMPKLGNFKVNLDQVLFYQLKEDFQGSILSLDITRIKNDVQDKVVYEFQELPSSSLPYPLIIIHCKTADKINSVDITIRNFLIEYYTNWLKLFGEENVPVKEEEIAELLVDNVRPATPSSPSKRFDIRYTLHDCVIGLNPGKLSCKSYLVIGKGTADVTFGVDQFYIKCSFRNMSMLLIDDTQFIDRSEFHKRSDRNSRLSVSNYTSPLNYYLGIGYVSVAVINSAHVGITFNTDVNAIMKRNKRLGIHDNLALLDLKLNLDELQVDLCADSTHVLLQLINDLKLPLNFKDEEKMKVKVDKPINLLQSIDEDEFQTFCKTSKVINGHNGSVETITNDLGEINIENSSLSFKEDHFTKDIKKQSDSFNVDPIRVNVNLSKTKIYLYDGYDWRETRRAIKGAVKRVGEQAKVERKKKQRTQTSQQGDPDTKNNVRPHETLFQSIHVSLPKGSSPSELTDNINKGMQLNNMTQTDEESIKSQVNVDLGKNYKNLKVRRSNVHKILVDLKNIEVNLVVFSTRDPRKDETNHKLDYELLNSVEVRLGTIDIYDNVATSTWNKFLSYMNILGEREIGTSMLTLSITNVRPDPSLVSGEALMKVSVLPIRLHIDQDTLDFLTRFLSFRDSRFNLPLDEIVYIQRFEMSSIKLKIDYKPKKIDYAGIRSGNTSEFVNFFVLDGSTITLEKVILHGILGFPKLGEELGTAWAPNIQQTQIAGILAGLSPIRSIVNIGGGVKDLIAIPISEYKKDGRLIRSLQKGTTLFAKTTGYEILNLGAKLASGTQVLLEQGEEFFGGEGSSARSPSSHKKKDQRSNVSSSSSSSKGESQSSRTKKKPIWISDNQLLARSHLLTQSTRFERDQYGSKKKYSYYDIDDDEDDDEDDEDEFEENELLSRSLFVLEEPEKLKQSLRKIKDSNNKTKGQDKDDDDDDDDNADDDDNRDDFEEIDEKLISLYSNQPESAREGLALAYKSLGKNLNLTKKQIINLKNELNETDNFQDAFITVLKSSPVILIRPIIGTTEAISKTLMGIGNEIDSKHMIESKDKYRYKTKNDDNE